MVFDEGHLHIQFSSPMVKAIAINWLKQKKLKKRKEKKRERRNKRERDHETVPNTLQASASFWDHE